MAMEILRQPPHGLNGLLKTRLGWRAAIVGLAFAITVPIAKSGAPDPELLAAAQLCSACAILENVRTTYLN